MRRNSALGRVGVGVWRDVDNIVVCMADGFVVGVVVRMVACWAAPCVVVDVVASQKLNSSSRKEPMVRSSWYIGL